MDTQTLTEGLRALETDTYTWKMALYATHKSRDGLELTWSECKMGGISGHVGNLVEYLLKKPVADKPVAPYSPFLSDKENIGALERKDEMIFPQMVDILLGIANAHTYAAEDFISGVAPKSAGYAFLGQRALGEGEAEQVLLMRRGNPFLSPSSALIGISLEGEIARCDKPVLKFPMAVDFMLLGEVCYFLSSAIEKDLSLENRHFAIAQTRMELIAAASVVSDYDRLEACVMKAKNARKFLDFDKSVLEHIARLSAPDREEFLSVYGVSVDLNGRMDTSEEGQCELIVDLLCCRSCLDPLGRLSVGSNITPRE